jgi:small subunit ribosomal protein S6
LRKYETVLIWSASLSEAELTKETGSVQELVTNNGGELTGFDDWGRRQLAYLINKESEGVYHFVHWKGSSDVKLAIDKMLRINDNCLRHLTLKDDRNTVVESAGDSPAFDSGE